MNVCSLCFSFSFSSVLPVAIVNINTENKRNWIALLNF